MLRFAAKSLYKPQNSRVFLLHTSPRLSNASSHSPDSYSKDNTVDPAPEGVFKVDPSSETVQGPGQPTGTGKWTKNHAYDTLKSEEQPDKYGVRGESYGSVAQGDKGKDTSQPGEGPSGGSAGGRGAEGR